MDRATPNLPSRQLGRTSDFYGLIGFREVWRDDDWMILARGELQLEFFLHPEVDPATSWFSCCLRVDDLDALYAACKAAGLAEREAGWPRLHAPTREASGLRIGALIDLDGTLVRLIENQPQALEDARTSAG